MPPRLDPLPPPVALGGTRFVAFGDSITAGAFSRFDEPFVFDSHPYPRRVLRSLQQTFPLQSARFTVENEGIPGEHASDGRNRIASVLRGKNFDGLLLLEGINDLNWGSTPARTAAAVVDIVEMARTFNVTVLLATMPQTYEAVYPNGQRRTQAADQVVPFNTELRRRAAGMPNVHIVDLYAQFGTNRSLMGNDGIHPTDAGYTVMASTFVQAIERVFRVRGSLQ